MYLIYCICLNFAYNPPPRPATKKSWRSTVLERQLRPSAGCTGSLLDASGHAHTWVPPGVGMQKWLQPPLFTEHAFFTPDSTKHRINSSHSA